MKLEVEAFVDASVAIVPDAEVKLVIDDVASDVRPLSTDNVPLDVRDVVAVTEPPVNDEPERVVMYAVIPFRSVTKKLDDVAFVLLRSAIVADADVSSVIVAVEIVVVDKVEVPVTTNCPVVVELVTVKSSMNPTSAWKKLAKRLVEDAEINIEDVAKKLVAVAEVSNEVDAVRLLKSPLYAEKFSV